MNVFGHKPNIWVAWLAAFLLFVVYTATAPHNHSEAEDVYHFAKVVEQGTFADQAGVNRVLALPAFGAAYHAAQALGFSGRAFPFMIFVNRLLAIACVFLFWKLLGGTMSPSSVGIEANTSSDNCHKPSASNFQLPAVLLFAFSYGFWRYANEAETYILASVFILAPWCLARFSVDRHSRFAGDTGRRRSKVGVPSASIRESRLDTNDDNDRPQDANVHHLYTALCILLSAIGILIHLLNLIPLLLIIPLYYLLSKAWKKALLHGLFTGLLVAGGYAVCYQVLDWNQLGAQHHGLESGFRLSNLLRATVAFGQCLVSGNFLFGFESFREVLAHFFPSRMLAEEFYMAQLMPEWVLWAGIATLTACGVWCVCVVTALLKRARTPRDQKKAHLLTSDFDPLTWSVLVWLILYALAVIHTEAGSPELWIMALIPLWLLVAPFLKRRLAWGLATVLCVHNLVAGLLPVMPERSDYHAAKGRWLVENSKPDDLILSDYEPVMIFYLNYFSPAQVVNSGSQNASGLKRVLGDAGGNIYALGSFFHPMESMKVRNPELYERMRQNSAELLPYFVKIKNDGFGGIYMLKDKEKIDG